MKIFYKSLLAVLWLQLVAVDCSAQLNLGYMGRKLFLELGTSFGFNVRVNKTSKSEVYQLPPIFAFSPNIDLNYTIGRKAVAKLGWSPFYFYLGTTHEFKSTASQWQEHEAFYKVHINDIHLDFDLYVRNNKGNIAPMGSYFKIGLRLINTARTFQDGTPGIRNFDLITEQDPLTVVGIDLGYGYRRVVASRFLLSICLSSTISPQTIVTGEFKEINSSGGYTDYNTYRFALRQAITERYLLSVDFGIGVFLTR